MKVGGFLVPPARPVTPVRAARARAGGARLLCRYAAGPTGAAMAGRVLGHGRFHRARWVGRGCTSRTPARCGRRPLPRARGRCSECGHPSTCSGRSGSGTCRWCCRSGRPVWARRRPGHGSCWAGPGRPGLSGRCSGRCVLVGRVWRALMTWTGRYQRERASCPVRRHWLYRHRNRAAARSGHLPVPVLHRAGGGLLAVAGLLGTFLRPTSDDWCVAWKTRIRASGV